MSLVNGLVNGLEIARLPGWIAVRAGARASLVLRPRRLAIAALLLTVTAAVVVLSVAVGSFWLPVGEVLRGLVGRADQATTFILRDVRLPRVLLAVLVGAAFGLAGAVTQSVTGNPLASPDILGVTAGAGAAAVFVIVVVGPQTSYGGATLFGAALVGGLATAVATFGLSWRSGLVGNRLILVGVGLGAALTALTSLLLARAQFEEAQRATAWLVGNLAGRGWPEVRAMALVLLVCAPPLLAAGRSLRLLRLGDDVARSLGTRVTRLRVTLLLFGVALAAVATAAAGPVAFVGLLAPLVAGGLCRTAEVPLGISALVGALLVVAADLAARLAPTQSGLPVGAVTAVLGGPVLLWLLHRGQRTRP